MKHQNKTFRYKPLHEWHDNWNCHHSQNEICYCRYRFRLESSVLASCFEWRFHNYISINSYQLLPLAASKVQSISVTILITFCCVGAVSLSYTSIKTWKISNHASSKFLAQLLNLNTLKNRLLSKSTFSYHLLSLLHFLFLTLAVPSKTTTGLNITRQSLR